MCRVDATERNATGKHTVRETTIDRNDVRGGKVRVEEHLWLLGMH